MSKKRPRCTEVTKESRDGVPLDTPSRRCLDDPLTERWHAPRGAHSATCVANGWQDRHGRTPISVCHVPTHLGGAYEPEPEPGFTTLFGSEA